jgi:hypothetical protein
MKRSHQHGKRAAPEVEFRLRLQPADISNSGANQAQSQVVRLRLLVRFPATARSGPFIGSGCIFQQRTEVELVLDLIEHHPVDTPDRDQTFGNRPAEKGKVGDCVLARVFRESRESAMR